MRWVRPLRAAYSIETCPGYNSGPRTTFTFCRQPAMPPLNRAIIGVSVVPGHTAFTRPSLTLKRLVLRQVLAAACVAAHRRAPKLVRRQHRATSAERWMAGFIVT